MAKTRSFPRPDPIHIDRGKDMKFWPRRLLHVPTMTSVEREGACTYNGLEKPEYNIISYTWGRYERPDGPRIRIKNVSWQIPSIDPKRFTVHAFQRVIEKISTGVDFIWIDIACIDQSNHLIKLEEIGRQAGIFSNAKDAFIWLHGTTVQTLQQACDNFFQLADRLDGEVTTTIYREDPSLNFTMNYEPDDAGSDIAIGENDFIAHCLKDPIWLESIQEVLKILMSDVWFSSLWTLQEAYLRPEALILSRAGLTAHRKGYGNVALLSLLVGMGLLERHLSKALHLSNQAPHELDAVRPTLLEIDLRLQQIGLEAWENPNMLYHSTKFRQSSILEDRIYGIMQVFGFRLGATASPSRSFTLNELEEQFALEINAISPIWGQMFVHTQVQTLGNCWRLSQESHVPMALRFVESLPASMCSIKKDRRGIPTFDGLVCSFRSIARLWATAAAQNEGYRFWSVDNAMQVISLDETDFAYKHVPENLRHCEQEQFEANRGLTDLLASTSGDELHVLLLGRLLNAVEINELDSGDESEPEDDTNATGSVGLLARSTVWNGKTVWQRLGVCVWAMMESERDIWAPRKLLLG